MTELRGKKASDFMDNSLLNELESEGFFAGLQGQKRGEFEYENGKARL